MIKFTLENEIDQLRLRVDKIKKGGLFRLNQSRFKLIASPSISNSGSRGVTFSMK
jgi:hypothetical protein